MSTEQLSALRATEAAIVDLIPTVCDMVATIVESPAMTWEDYSGFLEAADLQGPLLFVALLRLSAGFAAVCELTPEQVRGFGRPDAATY